MATPTAYTANHSSEPSDPQSTLAHSRNLSTISSTTLHTNTTLHSQPYEPLLRPISGGSGEYYDVVSHQSGISDRILALPRWSQTNVNPRSPSIVDEKREFTERKPWRRIKVLHWSKNILLIIRAAWAIYNTVCYLLAFTIYQGVTGQIFSLALGASTGLSFALTSCASILSVAQTSLLRRGIPVRALVPLGAALHYLASCCLLGPSIVNLVLLFTWRNTSDLELLIQHRCRLDVDLVWSTTYSLCNRKRNTWGIWIALAAFRLLITLFITIAFHLLNSSSQFMPIRRLSKPRYTKSKKSHTRLDSSHTPLMPGSNTSVVVPQLHHDPSSQHQISESTLSAKSSPRNRLRPARSGSSAASVEGNHSVAPSYNNLDFLPVNEDNHDSETGFVDRFRSLISQITRETEEGLAFARSDDTSSSQDTAGSSLRRDSPNSDQEDPHHQYNYHDDEDDFYAARVLSEGDYHQPYPADEHVRMMNAYVRRMPTIESMGSREMKSSLGASSLNTNRDRNRPPTRNTLLSWAGSDFSEGEPRSRPNSLSAQAELLANMFGKSHASEIGELLQRETVRMVDSQSANEDGSEALGGEYSSSTSGSKETVISYHTAATSSTVNSLTMALADASGSPLSIPSNTSSSEESEPPVAAKQGDY
ncbi:hypothetical protein M413DRAFT_446765 [Hebeloma cylindrosporum]|uniref:Uncharacterized protein n=1 Tax=Hebeloma cylindrosporum TaxID=76867 RepID=A0A0C3C8D0_HEBCY|nr:hypothetical protein M413DRAFT_446765 [Hebeloma cylindrosporum h7]